jgi:hypothetical protein
LLAVWEDWSIFPASYLSGLSAFFYLSENDMIYIKQQITVHGGEDVKDDVDGVAIDEDGNSPLPQQPPPPQQEHDLETLKRRAKLSGISITDQSTAPDILAKIDYVERYIKIKKSGGSVNSREFSIHPSRESVQNVPGMRLGGAANNR